MVRCVSINIREQLLRAAKKRGATYADLARVIWCDPSNVGRKLRGEQSLTVDEAQALAGALRVRIAWGRK